MLHWALTISWDGLLGLTALQIAWRDQKVPAIELDAAWNSPLTSPGSFVMREGCRGVHPRGLVDVLSTSGNLYIELGYLHTRY